MATGLGEAIGLQNTTKQQGDPLSWLRLAGAEKRAAKAQDKKDQQKLISDADFNVPWEKGILKPWGKQIARVKGALLEQYWKDAQIDSVTAYNKFYTNLGAAKAEVGSLLASNSNALEHTKLKKSTHLVDEKFQLMLNTDVDFATLAKYVEDTGLSPYVNINDQGAFSYTETPVFDTKKEVKWERADFNNKKYLTETKRPSGVMGTSLIMSENRISDESVVRKTQQVGQSPQAINAFLFENRSDPEIRRLSQSENIADQQLLGTKVGEYYHNKIKALVPPSMLEEVKFEEDKPSSGGQNPKVAAPLQYNTVVTVKKYKKSPKGKIQVTVDAKGNKTPIEEGTFQKIIPLSIALPNSKPVAIQINDKTFDAETNLYLKNKSESISFRANGIELIETQEGLKAYAVGDIVKNVGEDENGEPVWELVNKTKGTEAEKRETVYRIKVPLDETGEVNSMARALNPREMNAWDVGLKKFMESNKKQGKGSATKMISFKLEDGEEYEGTQEQIDAYKKKNPNKKVIIIK